MKIRAKMQVQSVKQFANFEEVEFAAVYGGSSNAEDNTYASATPSASLRMSITNPSARGVFKPDMKFYVDFTPEAVVEQTREPALQG